MSYRRVPFQFNPDRSSDERRSEILRRFGFQPEEDNMFYETNSPSWSSDWAGRFHRPAFYDDPEWRNTSSVFGNSGSMPGSPQSRMRRGWTSDLDEGGVPIKVVHEGTSSSRGGDEGDAASETSSQGSRSSCSSGGRGNGTNNGASGSKPRHEPRVHHIPIMVEPRTGSSSSGYASDGEVKPSHSRRTFAQAAPKDQAAAASAPTAEPRNIHTVPIQVDGYVPQRSGSRDHYDEEMAGDTENVRTVPIAMDCGDEAMARCRVDDPMDEQASGKSWAHTFPRQKSQQSARNTPTATKSSSGGKLGPQATAPTKQGSEPPPQQQQKQQTSAEEHIRRISLELADLRQQVLNFNGKPGDKQYKFLDEMLTRLMIKLDSIDPAGNDDIRKLRKAMVKEVQTVINLLEGKPPTYALVEVVPQEVVEAQEEAEQLGEMSQDGDEGATEGAHDGAAVIGSANVGDMPAKSEQAGISNTPECAPPADAQKIGSKDETLMEVEATATSKTQPSQAVELAPMASGGAGAEEPTVPEPPAVPMPVDIDTSLADSGTSPIGEPNAGSASPFNEQNLSSLDNSSSVGEATHLENTIPTEHSGTDL
uniref:Putative bag family molecular chaperone regulator 3 n=1 Tax=Amblyomma aureolatum TaxID=187763 RepID=A0A1E1X9C7_9ACAR